jgi:hypothetical protein
VPGSGLSPTITTGTAWIDGYVVTLTGETVAVTDNATSTVYLGLSVDGNDNVTGIALSITIPASGYYVTLGTVTAASGDISGVGTTGRSPETQADPIPTDADEIAYDNSVSGLTATDVQEAVDELAARPMSAGWDGVTGRSTDLSKNNTTFASLVSFTAVANKTYLIEADILIVGGAGGAKMQITVPSGGSADLSIVSVQTQATMLAASAKTLVDIGAASSQNLEIATSRFGMIKVTGIVVIVATAGTVAIEAAQHSASGTTVFKAGSNLKWKDVT